MPAPQARFPGLHAKFEAAQSITRGGRFAAAVVAAAAVVTSSCATIVRRGESLAHIHAGIRDALVAESYECKPSPDMSYFNCTHPEKLDLNFAYLMNSNLVQLWAVFSREDETLVSRWRTGPCEPLASEVSRYNEEVVTRLVCTEKSFRFEMVTWVPEGGLSNGDIAGTIDVFRTIVVESIRSWGFLPATDASPAGGASAEAPAEG